jgi:transcriptional regulator with XRE-family HTH domain
MKNRNENDCLGNVIKATRNEKQVTQAQLAERLKITARYLVAIENGQKSPSYGLLFRLIRELDINPEAIFYPEKKQGSQTIKKLCVLLNRCDEKDLHIVTATLRSILETK